MGLALTTGLRERHKISTRQALEDAALRLFARDGYDATTIEAITAEVDVSPRTFFRYFAAKDEVVLMGWPERQARLTALVGAAPPELDDLRAAAAALVAIAEDFETEHERVALRATAVATSVVLRGRAFDSMTAWQSTVAEALAERRGLETADIGCRVAAAAAVAVWLSSMAEWLGGPERSLADHLGAGFDLVIGSRPDRRRRR